MHMVFNSSAKESASAAKDKIQYPCLMIDRQDNDQLIVLFYAAGKGVIVSSDCDDEIGTYQEFNKLEMTRFVPFCGTITIKSQIFNSDY